MADKDTPPDFLALAGVDAQLQQTLATLQLEMQRALDARFRGGHQGRGKGGLQTFVEHRAYVPGDDLRHLDWRAFARRGKAHIKLYANEVRGTLELVLDASASMGYQSHVGGRSKWDTARALVYALGTLALKQSDAVGLSVWHDAATRRLAACAHGGQGGRLLSVLARLQPAGAGCAATAVDLLHGSPRARRVVVVSDFLRGAGQSVATLSAWARRGHDVCAVQLCHPDEAALPFAGTVELVDLETNARMLVHPAKVQRDFASQAQAFAHKLQHTLLAGGVRLVQARTDAALSETLRQVAGNF